MWVCRYSVKPSHGRRLGTNKHTYPPPLCWLARCRDRSAGSGSGLCECWEWSSVVHQKCVLRTQWCYLILLTQISPWSRVISISPSSLLQISTEQKPSPATCKRRLQRSGKLMSSWSCTFASPSFDGGMSPVLSLAKARDHPLWSYFFVSSVGPRWLHRKTKKWVDVLSTRSLDWNKKMRGTRHKTARTWNDESNNRRSTVA